MKFLLNILFPFWLFKLGRWGGKEGDGEGDRVLGTGTRRKKKKEDCCAIYMLRKKRPGNKEKKWRQ